MIRHIVHMRFRQDVSDAEKAAIYGRLEGLRDHLDGVIDFQTHRNISVETHVMHGFLDMFWFDFRDAMVRDAYLVDPVHQAIGTDLVGLLSGGLDGLLVCDIEMK